MTEYERKTTSDCTADVHLRSESDNRETAGKDHDQLPEPPKLRQEPADTVVLKGERSYYGMEILDTKAPLIVCRRPAEIAQELGDMQSWVQGVQDLVRSLPRERASLNKVRQARAELRRYFAQLETQRKLVKAEVMLPYVEAEKAYRALVAAPIEAADKLCKTFVDEVESAAKTECEQVLREYFRELCQMKGIFWLPFERSGVKVTMEMAAQEEPRKAKEHLKAFIEKVDGDLKAISHMAGSLDLLAEYESCLDLASAIERVQARKKALEIVDSSREAWEKMQQAAKDNTLHLAVNAPEAVRVVQNTQERKYTATFTVTATIPMLRGLKAFLEGNSYEYQEETKDE